MHLATLKPIPTTVYTLQCRIPTLRCEHMGVSKNNGTQKWMVKIRENPIKIHDLGCPYFWKDPYTLVLQIPLFIRRCLRTCLTHSGRAVSIGDITSSYHPYFLQNMQDFLNIHRFHLPHTLQFEEVKPTATHPAGSVDFSLRISGQEEQQDSKARAPPFVSGTS